MRQALEVVAYAAAALVAMVLWSVLRTGAPGTTRGRRR